MSGRRSFEFLDAVTSDLAFEAHGDSVEDVFAAAAEALLAASLEDPGSVEPRHVHKVHFEEPDLELLMLRFLNELIYLRDTDQLLLRPANLRLRHTIAGEQLDADLEGEALDPLRHRPRTEVKAATAHGLRVTSCDGGWRACVTLDV